MTKGRPADPSRAKRGTGNRPKPGEAKPIKTQIVPAPKTELKPSERFPPTPIIPAELHDVWCAAVDDLGGSQNMRHSYLPLLEAYCLAVYNHALAVNEIAGLGMVVTGPNGGQYPNPMLRVQKDSAATMLRLAETLGLTPAARVRLGLMEIAGASLLQTLNQNLDRR